MKTKNYVFVFFNLISLLTFSQTKYTLSGYVKEQGSKELLIGVTIYSSDKSAGTVSNDFGYYAMDLTKVSIQLYTTLLVIKPLRKNSRFQKIWYLQLNCLQWSQL
jgi:hypothetical protein